MLMRISTGSLTLRALTALLLLQPSTQLSAQSTWTQRNDLGFNYANGATKRSSAVSFSVSGKGYIGTGNDGARRKDLWEYDPATDSWSQKADLTGMAREYATGFSIGTKGYIGLGMAITALSDLWEFDPAANTWTARATFPGGGRENAVAFSIGARAYVGTGDDVQNLRQDMWQYDQASNTWTRSRTSHPEDDPATDTWTQKANFGGTAREKAVGFSIGGTGYIATGYDGTFRKDLWAYDPLPTRGHQGPTSPA